MNFSLLQKMSFSPLHSSCAAAAGVLKFLLMMTQNEL